MITLLCALSSNRDFPVFFTHKQKKSSPCSLSGSWSPFSLMCLPPSLWSSTSLRSVFVTFIIMESYNPTAGDTPGRKLVTRRGVDTHGPRLSLAGTARAGDEAHRPGTPPHLRLRLTGERACTRRRRCGRPRVLTVYLWTCLTVPG